MKQKRNKEINDYIFEINSNKTPIRNESINKYNKESQAINLNVNKIIKGKKSKKNKKKKEKKNFNRKLFFI